MSKVTLEGYNLFFHNPTPSVIYDLSTYQILDVNEAAQTTFGFTRQKFLEQNFLDLTAEGDAAQLANPLIKSSAIENYISFGVFTLLTNSDQKLQVQVNGYASKFNHKPCVVAVLEVKSNSFSSITSHKQMALNSAAVFCIINTTGNFNYVCAAARNQWGYEPYELIGRSMNSIFIENETFNVNSFFGLERNSLEKTSVSIELNKKNGTNTITSWSLWHDDTSNLVYALVTADTEDNNNNQLTESHELISKIITENSPDCLKILNLDGKLEFMNYNGLCQMEIDDFNDVKNKNWWDLWGNENESLVKESVEKARNGETVKFTAFCATAKGTSKCWDVVVAPANKIGEPVLKLISVSRDITELIEEQYKVKLSEEGYKALVQDGSDLIRILDADGTFLYVSPSSFRILGIKPEELIGKSIFDYIQPDDKENAIACISKIKSQKRVEVAPVRFLNSKGEWRWLESVLTNLLDNPAINGIVGNSRDVTERQRLQLLESVITHMKDAVLITEAEPLDEPGPKIIYANQAFTTITGYTTEEVIGKTTRILQGPNSNKEELGRLSKCLRNWEPCEITTINYKKSGEEFWINFAVNPVANYAGIYTHWVSIERDVTDQKTKELENELLAKIGIDFS